MEKQSKLKDQVCFLALGQCGGNIGKLFEMEGLPVLYINSALEDLNSLGDVKNKIHLKNGEGSHRDKDKAIKVASESIGIIEEGIKTHLTRKYIIVIAGTGGGTGCALIEELVPHILNLIEQSGEERYVCSAISIPNEQKESVRACVNALECVQFLENLKTLRNPALGCTMIIDNKRAEDKLSLNELFVKDFMELLVSKSEGSVGGNYDVSERGLMLQTPGMFVMAKSGDNHITAATLVDKLKEHAYTTLENDKKVTYIGIAQAKNKRPVDLQGIIEEMGVPYDHFEGLDYGVTFLAMSGLTFPHTRLSELSKKVNENAPVVNEAIKNLYSATSFGDVVDFNPFKNIATPKVEPEVNLRKQRLFRN